MTDLPNGPHNYYLPNVEKPLVAEVEGDWVWLAGDGERVSLRKCSGRFVKLVEVTEPVEAKEASESVDKEKPRL